MYSHKREWWLVIGWLWACCYTRFAVCSHHRELPCNKPAIMTNKSVQRRLRIIFLFIITVVFAWTHERYWMVCGIMTVWLFFYKIYIVCDTVPCSKFFFREVCIVRVPTTPGCVILEHTKIIGIQNCELAVALANSQFWPNVELTLVQVPQIDPWMFQCA